jgi:two-component system CheB/CheR fusion protein
MGAHDMDIPAAEPAPASQQLDQPATSEELLTVNQELKHTIALLAQRNDDLQNLINATAIGMLFNDRQLRITRYTPAALALFNLIPADLQRPLAHITHMLEDNNLEHDVEQVLNTLQPLEREVRNARGRWYLARFQPYRTHDDHINGVVLTFVDITERKQAEDALRESEARFRILTDAVPQVIWANEAGGAATYFNKRWFEYSGLSYEQSAGPGWQAIVHPDDAPASVEDWQRALVAGQVFDTEYRLRRADGVYRWFIGRNVPLRDADGQITGWFGSATDIEDLKQAEAARSESDERFRLLVEGARDYAMFLLDPDNRITFWSRGAERVFGWSEAEALGQSGDLIFVPEDRASGGVERELETAMRDGRAADRRWHQRKDGSRLFVDGVLIRLDDEQGDLRGFVKIGRDATEQRQAEDALLRAHDELEQRVAERTAELTRLSMLRQELLQRLVTAQEDERRRIALELHDSLGQYMSALTLNLARVQAIEGIAPQIRRELAYFQSIAAEIDVELDRLTTELRPPMLDDLGLGDALVRYVQEWSAANGVAADVIASGFEQARLPAPVETTAFRIVQEALTNVRKHAQAGQVSVIATQTSEELRIVIEDDGVGFDPEHVARSRRGGQQLGLVGMSERAAVAGGTVTVESEPGRGTTIYLRIPSHSQEDAQG